MLFFLMTSLKGKRINPCISINRPEHKATCIRPGRSLLRSEPDNAQVLNDLEGQVR